MAEQLQIEHGTIVGKEGYLFLATGTHNPVEFMTGRAEISKASLLNFQRNLMNRKRTVQKLGAKYQHFVAPDKHVVFKAAVPLDGVTSLAGEYLDRTAVHFTFPLESLRRQHSYWLTDTHWTPIGKLVAVRELAQGFGLDEGRVEKALAHLETNCLVSGGEFVGDLGRRFDPPRAELKTVFNPDWKIIRNDNGAGSNEGVCISQFSYHGYAEGRLLIFGDSFMMETIPYLSCLFKEVLFCRSRYLHREIVLQADADYVVTQNVERYLSNVDSDKNAPPFFLIPHLLGRTPKWEKAGATAIAALLSRRDTFYRKFAATLPDYQPLEPRSDA